MKATQTKELWAQRLELHRIDLPHQYAFILDTLMYIRPSSQPPGLAEFDQEAGVDYLQPAGEKLVEALTLYADGVFEGLWARHLDTGDVDERLYREARRMLTVKLLLDKLHELPRGSGEARGRPGLQDYQRAVEDLLKPVTGTV